MKISFSILKQHFRPSKIIPTNSLKIIKIHESLFWQFLKIGSIHKPCEHGMGEGGGLTKCPHYYISFIKIKMVQKWEGG